MDNLTWVYVVYGVVSVGLTVWLARTLFSNGAIFLESVFEDPRLAESVNRLLVAGFYMLNLGSSLMWMPADHHTYSDRNGIIHMNSVEAVETLAYKLGVLLVALGVVHFGNLYVFHRIRHRARLNVLPPPVAPQMKLQNQGA
jgi:hypothetical protein